MTKILGDKTARQWLQENPLLRDLADLKETDWFNPQARGMEQAPISPGPADVDGAAARFERFRPYIARAFPETREAGGLIESPLRDIPAFRRGLEALYGRELPGRLLAKCDSHLPISGSIKARGGIHEVLRHAEDLVLDAGMIKADDDYAGLADEEFREFFGRRSIAVGSTGNLGLSIGIMGARLGFRVTVHMSADARQWKKDLLRARGVTVVEHSSDYSQAVAVGRRQAQDDPSCHFVDDENSLDLFLGYAVAGRRLKAQFEAQGVVVDRNHPLFVYLPCGVGGGPGGVAFGLKLAFGDDVHCFFAEPTHSPAMLLGMYTGLHEGVCVQDFGIDNLTAADGLAVGRPSGFVGRLMAPMIDGAFTVDDDNLFRLLALMAESEGLRLEPSALAGAPGMARVLGAGEYRARTIPADMSADAVHVIWCTGGSMVPRFDMDAYLAGGRKLLAGA